jgi:formylglycine-generating enzyme required for sulfatase activity
VKNLLCLFILSVILVPSISHAEQKERIVVMRVLGKGLTNDDRNSYRTAIAQGLSKRYSVLSGNSVDAKVKEIFQKESRKAVECDTEKCFQDIAVAFQAELIAVTTVVKKNGGYILNLQINNVLENRNILSESKPCRGCDDFQVIDELVAMAVGDTATPPSITTPKKPTARNLLSPTNKSKSEVLPKSTVKNSTNKMVLIKGGCFDMGDSSVDGGNDEKPLHNVCLDDFYMDKYEVPQRGYYKKTGANPSYYNNCDNCPVDSVTWFEAKKYCESLEKRLPTEAEWEYAARSGGREEKWAGTNNEQSLADYAWSKRNSGDKTHPIGQKKPNNLGLHDMSGNVREWVSDWYGGKYYKTSIINNPQGPEIGENNFFKKSPMRVLRGGSKGHIPALLRTSNRDRYTPDTSIYNTGFRCAK